MQRKIVMFFIMISPLFCIAQKQGNVWYYGIQEGLSFTTGIPVPIYSGQTGTDVGGNNQEGTACISDSSGNILFYTGGKTIWNKNHTPMSNGSGLKGGTSSTQSSIIIPLSGSDSLFYVFTSDEFQSYTSPPEKGYCFNIVNMCLDNSNGDIIVGQKNILLLDSATEKLAACEDASGTGYWIMGHKMFSNMFIAWHLTTGGITNTVTTNIGTVHGWDIAHSAWIPGAGQGQMKFNPAGTKLVLAIGNSDPGIIDLFDFNPNTGNISNPCHMVIDSALHKNVYGVEFSPDGSKLYVGAVGGAGGKRLYQYNLTMGGGNCDSIITSRTTLFQSNFNSVMLGMQHAPNGKIYLIGNDYNSLSCINYPNSLGFSANFDSSAIAISGVNGYMMLPSFIAGYKYHNGIFSCASGNGIRENKLSNRVILFPNPTSNEISLNIAGVTDFKNSTITIQNTLGETIKRISFIKNIDVSNFPNGCYFLQITLSSGEIYKTKFIKQ